MYARSTTFTADPARLADGVAMVREEVAPTMQQMRGCVGVSMLCDPDSGRCIVTTSWDSQEAMTSSADAVLDMRRRAMEAMSARDASVDQWEIALMHRMHGAAHDSCARVTWTRGDAARTDDLVRSFRSEILPRLDDVPGFCSLSMMVDRDSGRAVLTAVYDSRADMAASGDSVRAMRDEFTGRMGMDVVDIAEYDLVIHQLRVPEMA